MPRKRAIGESFRPSVAGVRTVSEAGEGMPPTRPACPSLFVIIKPVSGSGLAPFRIEIRRAKCGGCRLSWPDAESTPSAFTALPSSWRTGARPLVSQHLWYARRVAPAVVMPGVRQVPLGAAGHGLLQPQDSRGGGLPLGRRHAARRHADLDLADAPPPARHPAPTLTPQQYCSLKFNVCRGRASPESRRPQGTVLPLLAKLPPPDRGNPQLSLTAQPVG